MCFDAAGLHPIVLFCILKLLVPLFVDSDFDTAQSSFFCILKIFFLLISAVWIQLYHIKTKLSTMPHSNQRKRLETFSDDLQERLKFCPEGCRLDNDKHSCVRSRMPSYSKNSKTSCFQRQFVKMGLPKNVCQTVALFSGVTVFVINNPAFQPGGKFQLDFKLISHCSSLSTHTRTHTHISMLLFLQYVVMSSLGRQLLCILTFTETPYFHWSTSAGLVVCSSSSEQHSQMDLQQYNVQPT